jgi:hypothetical protein
MMRRRSYGMVRAGGGGPNIVGWAAMPSLFLTSLSVSTSLRHSEGGNAQERMKKGEGEAEQEAKLWRVHPQENDESNSLGAIHSIKFIGSIHKTNTCAE